MYQFIENQITQFSTWLSIVSNGNEFLAAAMFGAILMLSRTLPSKVFTFIKRQLFVSIKLTDNKVNGAPFTYAMILSWHKNSKWSKFSRTLTIVDNAKNDNERIMSGYGRHFLIFEGSIFWIYSSSRELDNGELRNLVIETFVWNRTKISAMLLSIHKVDYTLPAVYELTGRFTNELKLSILYRIPTFYTKQTQFVDDNIYMEMDNRINRFVNESEYYANSSKTYKETFMLYGEPGTGKTNLIRHFSSKYNLPIISVNNTEHLKDVQRLIMDMGILVIILIEDVDTLHAFTQINDDGAIMNPRYRVDPPVSTSVILNYLDGVAPLSNCIVVMTTNCIEKIVPSIYRPGRVDLLLNITYPTTLELINKLDWANDDVRKIHMQKYLSKRIPMAIYVALRNANSVSEIDEIMTRGDEYFMLQENSGVTYFNKDSVN